MQLLRSLRKPYPTIRDLEVSKEIETFSLSSTARKVVKEVGDKYKECGRVSSRHFRTF